uniref:Uncharacterized protein n=1 Tax=Heterorhabditis bacteriophora TaxID=37862 RepID=A0A1I7W616_HETBA
MDSLLSGCFDKRNIRIAIGFGSNEQNFSIVCSLSFIV